MHGAGPFGLAFRGMHAIKTIITDNTPLRAGAWSWVSSFVTIRYHSAHVCLTADHGFAVYRFWLAPHTFAPVIIIFAQSWSSCHSLPLFLLHCPFIWFWPWHVLLFLHWDARVGSFWDRLCNQLLFCTLPVVLVSGRLLLFPCLLYWRLHDCHRSQTASPCRACPHPLQAFPEALSQVSSSASTTVCLSRAYGDHHRSALQ